MSILKLPFPILAISSSDLFDLIRSYCGQEVLDIVIAQKIPDIRTLLGVNDLFTIVHLPTNEFQQLKEKVAVQLHDGSWSVLIGFQARVDKFMNALREQARLEENEYDQSLNDTSSSDRLTLSDELLNKFPALTSLIKIYTQIQSLPDRNDLFSLIEILNNISANLPRSKNNLQYSNFILQFAVSLFIYSGQNAYRFVSLNIPGLLPSITTIRKTLNNSSFRMYEARFRFDAMNEYFSSYGSTFAFAAEDTTGVISKVTYDSMSNTFVGFNTPLAHGVPLPDQYQTDSYSQLQKWFENEQKSSFINVHMVQPLLNTSTSRMPSSFLLSAYGINGKYTADDVLNRWLYIYEEAKKKGIRLIGVATDCDSRYLRSMKLATGFLTSEINHSFRNHPDSFKVHIPYHWNWFFLESTQLCLFLQDGVHLCTKIRNRLLSKTTCLVFGNDVISHLVLIHIIATVSKVNHALVYSDVRPKDRQNFTSCQKICKDDVFQILKSMNGTFPNTNGIFVYLKLIQSVINAYCSKNTLLTDRLYYAWLSVFICRIWRAWLNNQSQKTLEKIFHTQFTALVAALSPECSDKVIPQQSTANKLKQRFTITNPCLLSIEINAHSLTYLVLLAVDGQLPFEALSIELLCSQSCEGVFREARAMSGVSSNIVNFTVLDFLRRADKISALQSIKTEQEYSSNLRFPKHHKHGKSTNHFHSSSSSSSSPFLNSSLQRADIETIVEKAFSDAFELIEPLIGHAFFKTDKYKQITSLFEFSSKYFKTLKLTTRSSQHHQKIHHDSLEESDSEQEDEEDEDDDDEKEENEENEDDDQVENEEDDDEEKIISQIVLDSSDASFKGMRVKESIDPKQTNSFFKVRRENDTVDVYIHKQTACWVMTNEKTSLSSDRSKRVTQAK